MSFSKSVVTRALVLASVFAAAAVVLSPLSGSAPSAHAAMTSCVISPGLAEGAFREGITCLDGIDTPGGGYSPGKSVSGCSFAPDTGTLPPHFLDFLSSAHADDARETRTLPNGHSDTVYYLKNGTAVGQVTYVMRNDGTWSLVLYNSMAPGYVQGALFDCSKSKDGFEYMVFDAIDLRASLPGMPVAPTGPTNPVRGLVSTSTAASPLPGRPGEYLVRVDVANTSDSVTPIDLSLDTSSYSVIDVLGSPTESLCRPVEQTEHCTLDSVDPGLSKTYLFHVRASAGTSSTFVRATVSNEGSMKIPIFSGAPSVNHQAWVMNTYRIDLP